MSKPMPRKTWLALLGSVHKWKLIWKDGGTDGLPSGEQNCLLCELFPSGCHGCPVGNDCRETPHRPWVIHQYRTHHPGMLCVPLKVECPICRTFARKELDFLCGLARKVLKGGIDNE